MLTLPFDLTRILENIDKIWEEVTSRKKVFIDFETYSEADIGHGNWNYSLHPSTEILCMAYHVDGEDPGIWVPGYTAEPDFLRNDKNYQFHAHNVSFEYSIWENVIVQRMGGVPLPPDRWYDTMAKVASCALPLSLENAGGALKLAVQKNLEGKRIMQQLSKPRRPSAERPELRYLPGICEEWNEKFHALYEYCEDDVAAERAIDAHLPDLSKDEYFVWLFNQITNLIGVPIDRKAVKASLALYNQFTVWADKEAGDITDGAVSSLRQVGKYKIWLAQKYPAFIPQDHADAIVDFICKNSPEAKSLVTSLSSTPKTKVELLHEVICDTGEPAEMAQTLMLAYKNPETGSSPFTLNKESIETLLKKEDLPEEVRESLELRKDAGKASVSKVAAMDNCASLVDDRVRWSLQYHAASTGREGGRLIQPQNMTKPSSLLIEQGLKAHNLPPEEDPIPYVIEDIKALSLEEMIARYESPMQAISGSLRGFIKAPEGYHIVAADYNAIEARVLFWFAEENEALGAYRSGADLYSDMASFIYKKPITKKTHPKERDLGKATILGCGFGMFWAKFYAQCQKTGIQITEQLAKTAVNSYRKKYAGVPRLWDEVEKAAINTLLLQQPQSFGKGYFEYNKELDFLYMVLPSGRKLCYAEPRLKKVKDYGGSYKWELNFKGVDKTKAKLVVERTWGAKLVENLVQATARDIMVSAVQRAFKRGYLIFMCVHDEIVSLVKDVDIEKLNVVDFEKTLVTNLPAWAADIPLAAEGWSGKIFKK